MNKTELVDQVANEAGLPKLQATAAVDAMVGAITNALKAGDSVSLIGFGTFMVKERPARTGRNPRTGEQITISAGKQPKFRPGKGLKDAVGG